MAKFFNKFALSNLLYIYSSKCSQYKEVISKLKSDLLAISTEYDTNIKNLMAKFEKQKLYLFIIIINFYRKEIEERNWTELTK